MAKIQLISTRELDFPPFYTGYVLRSVEWIQNLPKEERYILKIVDTCFTEVEEEVSIPIYPEGYNPTNITDDVMHLITFEKQKNRVNKILGTPMERTVSRSYAEIKELAQLLQSKTNIKQMDLDDAITEAFRQGLYLITKDEIENQGLKWYKCESIADWKIVRD
ncbi:hypothetical protein [Riemerella anatipestifer]|uniref:hypothetical protein n=1 Tax=Riemerella anatipestifer TaxID=34085 RepID=UPI00129EEA43|nr:hypothetical protein [Riemerella anatipestifer]MRM96414.1 hypothetical protein [Riemerella anatipestifer]